MNLENIISVRPKKLIYRDGNKAIKVFDETFSKADILNEALNQARIEETHLNIPKIHEITKVDGKWAIISDYIEGKTLESLMQEDTAKLDEYLNLFVNLQIFVNSQRASLLNKQKDKMLRKISETSLDETTKYDLQIRLEGMPNHNKVCHGDFNPSNIIITPEKKSYILDWSHVTQGNASADVARTYLLFCLDKKINIADNYLNLFCKKTGTKKHYVQMWFPIVAASQMVNSKLDEQEFLKHWVHVVDYE